MAQTNVTSDGVDAARSGIITNSQSTWLETIVTGPGILRFWWKASCETNRDWLIFYINGVEQARISGEVDWHQRGLDLPAGGQTLQWVYSKDGSGSAGQDRVWLDQVEFIPTTGPTVPVILTQPVSRGVLPGVTVTFEAEAGGTGPLNCQWYFNGHPIADGDFVTGSTTARLTLTDVQGAQEGTYNLVVRNAYSVATSSNAVLTLMSPVSLAQATDTADWIWFNAGYAGWVGQTETSNDRVDAAESAPLVNGQTNWMQTEVLGPGAVSFWWKVSSETNRDRLRFIVNGVEQANISGEVDWRWRTFDVGVGNQVLVWAYTKDAGGAAGLDRGWIDQIQFGPSAPVITNKPSSQVVDIGTTVKFEVDAGGTPPLTYQWQFNGTNLTDGGNIFRSTKDRLVISNALPSQSGNYAVLVSNPGGKAISQTASLVVNPGLPLAEALNTPDWIYVPAAYSFWVGQTEVTHDGVMAARSGSLPNSETASMQTTVNGPGTLKFWWRVSSESNRDWLKFFVNSNEFVRISGEVAWQQKIYELPPGPQILRWDYSKDSINTNGQDRAWVDQIEFSQTPPVITNQPASQTVDANTTVTFTVGNIGTPPFGYQWRLNGTNLINSGNISGANSSTLRITGVLPAQAGNYSVLITNQAGQTISATAVPTINAILPLAEALDMPGLTWSVSGSPPWVGQALVSHDNADAARSGAVGHDGDTRMETTVVGPAL